MQVSLNENEVRKAVDDYIRERLRLSTEEQVTIEMVATRGSDGGCKAVIEIVEPAQASAAKTVQPKDVVHARHVESTPKAAPVAAHPKPVTEAPVVEVAVDAGGDVLVEQPAPVKRNALFSNLKTPT
jgi:hypothetical protein